MHEAHAVARDDRPYTLAPVAPARRMPAGEAEADLDGAAGVAQILGPEANDGVGALLEIAAADLDREHRVLSALVSFRRTVVEQHVGTAGPDRERPQPGGEAPWVDGDTGEARGGRDAGRDGAVGGSR